MSENIEFSYVWDHTIIKILNHDIHSKMGNMIKEWVVFNKLEDFNSLLEYTDDDFTSTGIFCYINEKGEKLYRKFMKEFHNLRWYIQHLVDQHEYQDDENEWTNPLHESNWTYRTNKQFMNYENFTLKEMTPEQMKMNSIKPIIKVKTNEELDTEEGESNSDEQDSTISNKEEDEYSTFPDMSNKDSEADINVDETQHQENSYTPETLHIHNTYNTSMHDKHNSIYNEYDTSENENIIEIETYEHYGEKIHETEESIPSKHLKFLLDSTKQYIMKMIHQMTNLRLKLNHQKRMGSNKLENRKNSLLLPLVRNSSYTSFHITFHIYNECLIVIWSKVMVKRRGRKKGYKFSVLVPAIHGIWGPLR